MRLGRKSGFEVSQAAAAPVNPLLSGKQQQPDHKIQIKIRKENLLVSRLFQDVKHQNILSAFLKHT